MKRFCHLKVKTHSDYNKEGSLIFRGMPVRKSLLFLLLLATALGCGLDNEEKVEDAIVQAHQLLTSKKCAEALAILEGVGTQPLNPEWLQTYASANACAANWSVITFFADDLPNIEADYEAIIGILATFGQAVMTSPTDSHYTRLQSAINTLLYAGGISSPSNVNRRSVLTAAEVNNIDVQNLYMILNQIGQFARYYGNASPTSGIKSSGSGANTCYIDYTDTDAQVIVTAVNGDSCVGFADGHPELTGNRERMCQGVVLFNNFLDILANVSLSSSSNSGDLDELAQDIEDLCVEATQPPFSYDLGATCTVKSQSVCVANPDGNLNLEHLERFYAAVWESLHQ